MLRPAMALLTLLAVSVPAQIEEDPRTKMKEILEQVANEMAQIDKLLQESSRSNDAARGMKANVERLDKLLDSVSESQKRVVQGIDDLLKEAEKMKGDQQGNPLEGGKPGQKQQPRGRDERQRRQRNRGRQRPQEPPELDDIRVGGFLRAPEGDFVGYHGGDGMTPNSPITRCRYNQRHPAR